MDDETQALVRDLHDHLRATEERPLPEAANRWLGEAQAVAADAVGTEVPVAVVTKRVGQVAHLLSHVEETGDDEADEHVAAARDLAERILSALDSPESDT